MNPEEDFEPYYSEDSPRPANGMAIASVILGILSILTCCCGIGGIVFGSIGIILAVLSRGQEPMENCARVGLGISITGLVLGFLLIVYFFLFSLRLNVSYDYSNDAQPYHETAPYGEDGDESLDDYIEHYGGSVDL